MNSSHFSRLAVAAVLLVVLAAGPIGAVSVSGDTVPEDGQVDSAVDVTYTLEELYTNYDEWTLEGETDLESLTWTVRTYDVGGSELASSTYEGQSFEHDVAKADDVAEVTVRLEGEVPSADTIENEVGWSYDPAQTITLASFEERAGGSSSTLSEDEIRPHSGESQAARDALDSAQSAIEDATAAGVDTSEADDRFSNAVSSFEAGNFGNSEDLADDARVAAESAQQSAEQQNTLLLIGGAVVVLAILAGLGYWYLSNRETYDKLG